jgi:formylglycine-generating enzyme required for sulfatase activity
MDFVFVPAGTFQQGTSGTIGSERPFISTISRNYFVSRTEVTQAQWRAVYGSLPVEIRFIECGDECPVNGVNWFESVNLANRLSESAGLGLCYEQSGCTGVVGGPTGEPGTSYRCTGVTYDSECTGYRLLSESEWERATRAGTTSEFYWGAEGDAEVAGLYGWFDGNADESIHPVGQKLANAYGLYDVVGNVFEYVWDVAGRDGFALERYPLDAQVDYLGPPAGSFLVILRGGSWTSSPDALRSAIRDYDGNVTRSGDLGIRLARTQSAP